ncbi:MAG: hypothetical protein IJ649_01100 [Oscillospiraceae bacterium]|nr:hypothetical protein [Oscillospiraceae bacterium]
MALKDRIAEDIDRVFMNLDQFGEIHYWNGYEITCVPDDEESLKRKNNNVNDISWDNNTREILIHTPLASFPGGVEPEPNTHVMYDRRPMKVLDVQHNMGMLDILLTVPDPREVM